MGFQQGGDPIWPIPPDWESSVSETLKWGTNVTYASATAVSRHVGHELAPDRCLSFEVAALRVADFQISGALMAGHRGTWRLPIWPDVQRLRYPIAAGNDWIDCRLSGFDFRDGGQVLLWASPARWRVVDIASVDPDQLSLAAPMPDAWPAGTRLYPLRRARIRDGAEERFGTDQTSRRQLQFDIEEVCNWPMLSSPELYLTHPVLDARPDWSEDPAASLERMRQSVAYAGSWPVSYDLADQALRVQRTHWKLRGRANQKWFRSLLYTLDGRRVPMWVPSFTSDLTPVAAVAGGSASLQVRWAGYTRFGLGRHNRRDLRIELADGTVFNRRIINAIESGETEILTLDAALDAGGIAPAQIRSVSFLVLATLASDTVDIEHKTDADGTATATLGWQAVVPDV